MSQAKEVLPFSTQFFRFNAQYDDFGEFQSIRSIKQGQGHEGGIFTVEAPFHVSNVQVIDPVTGKPCKVGMRYLEDCTKVRVPRGIGASWSNPTTRNLKDKDHTKAGRSRPKDTPIDVVMEKTYYSKTGLGMPDL